MMTADVVPTGHDQVARKQQMMTRLPRAQAWYVHPYWYGAHPVGRWTWITGPRIGLRGALNAVERLADLDGDLRAVEAAWPGWGVFLSPLGTWHAWRDGVHAQAPDPVLLGAAIGAVEATVNWPPVTVRPVAAARPVAVTLRDRRAMQG